MRATVILLLLLVLASCVTPFPPGVIDPGRGAEPLPVGATSVGGSFAAGMSLVDEEVRQQALPVVASAGMVRIEHQWSEEVLLLGDAHFIAFPSQRAFAGVPHLVTMFLGGAQLNLGTPHLALRGVAGGGTIHRFQLGNVGAAIPDLHLEARGDLIGSVPLYDGVVTPYAVISLGAQAPNISKAANVEFWPAGGAGVSWQMTPVVSASAAIVTQTIVTFPQLHSVYGNITLRMQL